MSEVYKKIVGKFTSDATSIGCIIINLTLEWNRIICNKDAFRINLFHCVRECTLTLERTQTHAHLKCPIYISSYSVI